LQPLLAGESVDSQALRLAGEAELALGDAAAAEAFFQRATKSAPDDTKAQTALALAHLSRGDSKQAFTELASVSSATGEIVAEEAAYSARMRRGEFDAALEVVEQIKKKQPGSAAVPELRGKVYLAKQDYVEARKAFEEQARMDPKAFVAVVNQASIDLIERKPDEARKRLQAAIKADPKNMYAILALAKLRAQSGAPLEEIRQLYADAIVAQPRAAEPRLELISLTLRKRLYKEALAAAQEAAAALPSDPLIMDAVGRAQMEAGDVEQAISTFRRMAGSDSKSGLPYTRLADIYKSSGKRDQAEAALRRALEVEPDLAPAQTALVDLMVQGNRKAAALEMVRRIQRESPGKAWGYALEAALHIRLKENAEALSTYRTGLDKTGAPAKALLLHHFLGFLGKFDEADQIANTWLKANPKDIRFSYQVAELAMKRKQFDKAVSMLTEITAQEPDNARALNNLAALLVQQGKSGALPVALKAANLAPGNASTLDTLASAFALERQFDKALASQRQAAELDPERAVLRLHLAQIALQSGDKELARRELNHLKSLGRKFERQDEVDSLLRTL
jgi:putative PEP-CTERM system TPR-repeat lipoprotein